MKNILGFDFSINKPAACLLINNKYHFYSWVSVLPDRISEIYRNSGINFAFRENHIKEKSDSSSSMNFEIANSEYLAKLIVSSLPEDLDRKATSIAIEGLSFSSTGNVILQLGGYRYILMKELRDNGFSLDRIFTYAPISIKKTAGCSKRGMKKKDMIDSFMNNTAHLDIPFRDYIKNNETLFRKKTGNWIDHLDDLVDAFWAVRTHIEKS